MSIVTRIANLFREKASPAFSANWSPSWLAAAGRNPWMAGKPVPESLTAVNSAVSLLTAGILGGDFRLVRRRQDGGLERLSGGDLAAMLQDLPAYELQRAIHDWLIGGNGYLLALKNDRGGVRTLEWVEASRCSLHREHGSTALWLKVSPRWSDAQQEQMIAPGEFIHLRKLPSSSNIYGQSPLDRMHPGLATCVAVIEGAQKILENSIAPGALLVMKQALLKPEARQRLRDTLERMFTKENKGKLAVLDTEATIERLPTPEAMLSEAFVEMARFGVSEIARCYNVPLSLLAETQSTNRSTAEQESRAFATFSVAPLCRELAAEMGRCLLSAEERRQGIRIDIDLADALLGHGVERAEFASKLVNGGICTTNEARDLLGLGDLPQADELARPVNTTPNSLWLEGNKQQPAQPMPAANEAPAAQEARTVRREAVSTEPTESEIAEAGLRLIVNRSRDEAVFQASLGSDPISKLISRSM